MSDEAVIEPTKWRRRHGLVERLQTTIADAEGAIGHPFRVWDTLTKMEAHGRITATQHLAGDRFHELFRRAGLDDGLRAADLARIPVQIDNSSGQWRRPNSSDAAWWVVRTSLDALGGPSSMLGSCAWNILGLEQSIRDWVLHRQWGRTVRLNQQAAAGVLISVLVLLERHYRFVKP